MERWKRFRDTLGAGTKYRDFDVAARAELSFVPDFLKDLWAEDGWASYRGGLFWTVDPREFKPLIDLWQPPDVCHAVARGAFGSVYCLSEFVNDFGDTMYSTAKIDPHQGQYSVVGADDEMFLTEALPSEDYLKTVFWESKVKRAMKDVGPLEWDEMYAFEPALALGGSGEPETVRRVKLFDHHLLLSQVVGDLKFVKY